MRASSVVFLFATLAIVSASDFSTKKKCDFTSHKKSREATELVCSKIDDKKASMTHELYRQIKECFPRANVRGVHSEPCTLERYDDDTTCDFSTTGPVMAKIGGEEERFDSLCDFFSQKNSNVLNEKNSKYDSAELLYAL